MHLFRSISLLVCFVTALTSAQNKDITLEEIWNGTFNTENIDVLHSLNNGQQHAVLNSENRALQFNIYNRKTN